MYLKCPGDLMNESSSKINGVMIGIEGYFLEGSMQKNKITNLLSNKTVTIELKNDGYPSAKEAQDSYTIYVNYSRVQNSDNTIGVNTLFSEIVTALIKLEERHEEEILAKVEIMDKQFGDAKNMSARVPGTVFGSGERKGAWHRF
jgi:predicted PilT family ATPase